MRTLFLNKSASHAARSAVVLLFAFGMAAAFGACKARNPDAAGLLSEGVPDEDSEDGAAAIIRCRPEDPSLSGETYLFTTDHAAAGADPVAMILTVEHMPAKGIKGQAGPQAKGRQIVVKDALAKGVVNPAGQLFFSFPGGVLTADAKAGKTTVQGETHTGVLTIDADSNARALTVDCALLPNPPAH